MDEAILHLEKSIETETSRNVWPGNPYTHYDLGIAYDKKGRYEKAVFHFQKALAIQPGFVEAQKKLAWILATAPDATARNGSRALELALQADQLTGGSSPAVLRILAAAYAETGNFPQATATAERAYSIALMQADADLSEALRAEIGLYKNRTPYREAARQ